MKKKAFMVIDAYDLYNSVYWPININVFILQYEIQKKNFPAVFEHVFSPQNIRCFITCKMTHNVAINLLFSFCEITAWYFHSV